MKKHCQRFVLLLLGGLLCAAPALAAPAAAEAMGKVTDKDGNPIQGARVVFTAKSNPTLEYPGKSNKKGKYYVPGLFSAAGDEWLVKVEAEGYLPVEVTVESRTVNKVLVGDVQTKTVKPGGKIPYVIIKALGTAEIDFTMAPEDEIQAAIAQAQAAAAGAASAEGGTKTTAPVQPKRDPWEEALQLVQSGDYDGAIRKFDKAVEDEPEDAERREVYAKVLYQQERYDDAATHAQKAIELAPQSVGPRMVLYSVHVAKQDIPAAEATLVEAREIAPTHLKVLEQLAWIATEKGKSDEAITIYEEITTAYPENAAAWVSLGGLYNEVGNPERSEAAFERVVEIDPESAHQVFFNLGALTMNKPGRTDADTDKAVAAFRKAIERKPDYAEAHKQLAFALLGTGDRGGARSSLQAYVEFAPKAADVGQMQKLIDTLSN